MDLDLILPALESTKFWSSQQHQLNTGSQLPTSSSFCQVGTTQQLALNNTCSIPSSIIDFPGSYSNKIISCVKHGWH